MPAMLFVVSTNSIFEERIPMKSWFFYMDSGQDVLSGKESTCPFSPMFRKLLIIFSHPRESYQEVKERWWSAPAGERNPYPVGPLTGWRAHSLDLSRQDFLHNLKGLWSCRNTIQTQHQSPLSAPDPPFRLLPKHVFEKQDANKQQMLPNLDRIKRTQFNWYR